MARGKSTLLKVMLGKIQPTTGTVQHGTKLEVIYFDQLREQIDEDKTVAENVGEGQDMLSLHGKQKHIYGYLQEFLFTPDRARQLAKFLSGGERNRLLLARLFKRPSNVMVLDEPTNDLDAETLDLLEELVSQYEGTLLIVSHDRAFLNNVVTSTLVCAGDGIVKEYAGGYDDYLRQRNAERLQAEADMPATTESPTVKPKSQQLSQQAGEKLSYKERRELESLPDQIESLEQEQAKLHEVMADPEFFKQEGSVIAEATARLETLQTELTTLFERWEGLEARDH